MELGALTSPRGQKVLEIEDYIIDLDPYERFTSFQARKMSLSYLATEWHWYLTGDPFDDIVADKAQMWKDIQQPDGSFFSNYGQYWFGHQQGVKWVIDELRRDPMSRRAVIPMLNKSHLFKRNKDVVCTESISFRIREGKLNMSVNMRSNDAVWGMTNDVACFSFLHELVAGLIGVPVGRYRHKADSLHIYERHFEMVQRIIDQGEEGHYTIDCPRMDSMDVNFQYTGAGRPGEFVHWMVQQL